MEVYCNLLEHNVYNDKGNIIDAHGRRASCIIKGGRNCTWERENDKQAEEMFGRGKWSEDKVRWLPTCVKRQMEEQIRPSFISSVDCHIEL